MHRNSNLSVIEQKFRSGSSLDKHDKLALESIILSTDDPAALQSCIYIYGYEFEASPVVINKLDHYIFNEKIAGLTATCIKVAVDMWSGADTYLGEMESYLDFSLWDEWYDEVIVCANFFRNHPEYRTATIDVKLQDLAQAARQAGEVGVLTS